MHVRAPAARRAACRRRSRCAPRAAGVAVIFTAPEVPRNRDSDFPYRYDSYFHYLSGFPEPEARGRDRCRRRRDPLDPLLPQQARGARDLGRLSLRPEGGAQALRLRRGLRRSKSSTRRCRSCWRTSRRSSMRSAPDARLDAHVQRWLGAVRAQARAGVGAPVSRARRDPHPRRDAPGQGRAGDRDHAPGREDLRRRARACDAGTRGRAARIRDRGGDCSTNSGATARSSPPTDRSSPAAPMPACCTIARTTPAQGRRPAADRCRLRARRLCLRHHPHLPGQRALQRQHSASSTTSCSRRSARPRSATAPGRHFMEPHDAAVKVLAQGMIDCKLLKGSLDGVLESGATAASTCIAPATGSAATCTTAATIASRIGLAAWAAGDASGSAATPATGRQTTGRVRQGRRQAEGRARTAAEAGKTGRKAAASGAARLPARRPARQWREEAAGNPGAASCRAWC